MWHSLAHFWEAIRPAFIGVCVGVFFLPDALKALYSKRGLRAAAFFFAAASLWVIAFGPRLFVYLAFLVVTAFVIVFDFFLNRRKPRKSRLDGSISPPSNP